MGRERAWGRALRKAKSIFFSHKMEKVTAYERDCEVDVGIKWIDRELSPHMNDIET